MSYNRKGVSECPELDYFMNESVSDVVFVIEGQRLPAIKLTLSMKSKVFRAMFSGDFRESKDKEVVIKDTTFEAFKTFIQFLYCDRLVLEDNYDFQLIHEVCRLSDKYEVLNTLQKVDQHLTAMPLDSWLFDSHTFKWVSKLGFDYKLEKVMTKVLAFIDQNIKTFVKKTKKQLIELDVCTHNLLVEVMADNYRKLSKEFEVMTKNYDKARVELQKYERLKCPGCRKINNYSESTNYCYTCKTYYPK